VRGADAVVFITQKRVQVSGGVRDTPKAAHALRATWGATQLSPPTPHPRTPQDKLADPSSMTHLFKITESIGCVMTGVLPDAKALVQKARQTAAGFEFDNGFPIPVHYLAQKMADENQIYTQAAYKRGMAAVMILGA
jgi:hypothetical protein